MLRTNVLQLALLVSTLQLDRLSARSAPPDSILAQCNRRVAQLVLLVNIALLLPRSALLFLQVSTS